MDRMKFITHGLLGAGSMLVWQGPALQQDRPPALKDNLVKEFVRLGHFDLNGVKQMLAETPSLLNACWDWGGGDFETALGGASHMGERPIAEYLITSGCRMDIFCAAMMGELQIVEAMVSNYPSILASKGPHGITLLTHARKGGEKALGVVEYLQSKGVKE